MSLTLEYWTPILSSIQKNMVFRHWVFRWLLYFYFTLVQRRLNTGPLFRCHLNTGRGYDVKYLDGHVIGFCTKHERTWRNCLRTFKCQPLLQYLIEVWVPECHFPGTGNFRQKNGKSSVSNVQEHPLPGPDSVLFLSCFMSGNILEFTSVSRMLIKLCSVQSLKCPC